LSIYIQIFNFYPGSPSELTTQSEVTIKKRKTEKSLLDLWTESQEKNAKFQAQKEQAKRDQLDLERAEREKDREVERRRLDIQEKQLELQTKMLQMLMDRK